MKWKQFLTPVQSFSNEEARTYMGERPREGYTLLDVRRLREYEKERIPGATLVPLPELPDRMGELDPDKPVLVYCAVGGRSRAAAQLLAGKGFKEVYNLKGGIKAWQLTIATLQTREGVLSVAMMLEGQALDPYSRYAQKVQAPETRETLLGPADQDKGHLVLLGKMLEEPEKI